MKLKFRIITSRDLQYPFTVQQRKCFIWWNQAHITDLDAANEYIHTRFRIYLQKSIKQSVIKVYTEEDYIVDKLKGSV